MEPNTLQNTINDVAPDNVVAPAPVQSKKPKGLIIATAICAVLAIAGIAFGVYGVIQSINKSNEISNLKIQMKNQDGTLTAVDTNNINISNDQNTITITDSTKNDTEVRTIIDELQKAVSSVSDVRGHKVYDSIFSFVKKQNARGILPTEKSYGLYYGFDVLSDLDESSKIADAIIEKLKTIGFVENPDTSYWGSGFVQSDSDIYCNVGSGIPFTVGCGHLSWLSEEKISFANELYDAIYAKENRYLSPIHINNEYTINDSSISPYQTLKIPVSNATGLFYRVSPDADWQYFTGTQAVLNCSDYNTQDLKNAFAGEICYDGEQNSTVQP